METEKLEEKKEEVYSVDDFIKEYPLIGLPRSKSIFDEPCPDHEGGIIAENHEVNEWLLNHLPLSSEQKKTLIEMLIKDQKIAEKKEKHEKLKQKMTIKKAKSRTLHFIPIKEQHLGSLIHKDEITCSPDPQIEHSREAGGTS